MLSERREEEAKERRFNFFIFINASIALFVIILFIVITTIKVVRIIINSWHSALSFGKITPKPISNQPTNPQWVVEPDIIIIGIIRNIDIVGNVVLRVPNQI